MQSVKHPKFTLDCPQAASSSFSLAKMRYLASAGGWKKDTVPRISQSGGNAERAHRLLMTPNVFLEVMKTPPRSILRKVWDTLQLEPTELIRADIVDLEAEEIDLGDTPEDDPALDVEGQPGNEKEADMDALDTDDEAEDQALGIDTEESDGELPFLHCNSHLSLKLQSRCMLSHYILYCPPTSR
jgi:hypothetical protein